MKQIFALRHAAASILVASVIFGGIGIVHTQSGTAKKAGSSNSNPAAHTYGKDQARDYAISQGSGSHAYGKDQSADYAQDSKKILSRTKTGDQNLGFIHHVTHS